MGRLSEAGTGMLHSAALNMYASSLYAIVGYVIAMVEVHWPCAAVVARSRRYADFVLARRGVMSLPHFSALWGAGRKENAARFLVSKLAGVPVEMVDESIGRLPPARRAATVARLLDSADVAASKQSLCAPPFVIKEVLFIELARLLDDGRLPADAVATTCARLYGARLDVVAVERIRRFFTSDGLYALRKFCGRQGLGRFFDAGARDIVLRLVANLRYNYKINETYPLHPRAILTAATTYLTLTIACADMEPPSATELAGLVHFSSEVTGTGERLKRLCTQNAPTSDAIADAQRSEQSRLM